MEEKCMIDPGLEGKVALVTGGNNPFGIGAAIARALAGHGVRVFVHYYRQQTDVPVEDTDVGDRETPGLTFFFKQQEKTADEVVASIREAGEEAASWEGDLGKAENVDRLFEAAEKAFGKIDILVNNAAAYMADTFLPAHALGKGGAVWEGGPTISTIDVESHDRHFAVNSRAVAMLTARFAQSMIERGAHWGRIINISADCAWGCPKEISYRASKYALESYSRSAAAELGPCGITVNVVSPGPVQSGYISPEMEKALVPDIPVRRVGRPEDIANAVVFFASKQAAWITGQVLFVHGGHRMAFGQ
ncbi:MAG: SDR family oxidoreductase [Thermodesulfobacteriota bacterium]|nr:SDR family oxidoreductase [Thermodesulfobacteriota bacterium]